MATQLRPFNLGEILDRIAEIYRKNFLLFAGISVVFSGTMLLMQLLNLAAMRLIGYPKVSPHLLWVSASLGVVEALAILVLAGLAIAANNRAVAWVYLGETTTVRDSLRSVWPRLGRYLWLMFNTFLRAWSPLAVLYIALFAIVLSVVPLGFLTNPGAFQPGNPGVVGQATDPHKALVALTGILIVAPLLLAALAYGAWMSLRYSLAMPASVVEDLPALKALKRSAELTKGTKGRIFVLGLLVYAVRMLIGMVLGLPYMIFVFRHIGQMPPLGWMAEAEFAGFVNNTLIGPIYATGLTLFYYDQRVRKEGFDIVWMMQAAGLEAPARIIADGAAEFPPASANSEIEAAANGEGQL